MSNAGFQLLAGRIPGERIAEDIDTSNSANVTTTETAVMSVTAPLVSGRKYRVRFDGKVGTSQASVYTVCRIREDTSGGTQMQVAQVLAPGTATNYAFLHMEGEYTAGATANKTFVFTVVRGTGTGNHFTVAGATEPGFLVVEYISG